MLLVPATAGKKCVCKANGHDYHEGDIACILGKLSRCEMFVNNTTWKKIADDCPEVRLQRPVDFVERLQLLQVTSRPKAC